jgi:hypothetical protein
MYSLLFLTEQEDATSEDSEEAGAEAGRFDATGFAIVVPLN